MTREATPAPFDSVSESELEELFDRAAYVAPERVVTTVHLALRLGRPLLLEGPPGSGKTELGKVLAAGFDTDLVRLQCYEGLAAENALYEWNYTKQLLAVQADEGTVTAASGADGAADAADADGATDSVDADDATDADSSEPSSVFDEAFLLERPLLRALRSDGDRPPVLLIDEIDRADEAFEAFLLEVLSDFQVTIPELGTVRAERPPIVVLTSNRTRGLSDALKRRCLYLYLDPPSFERELEIVRRKVPELDDAVAAEVCAMVERLREEPLLKRPDVAETIDWARAVAAIRDDDAEPDESISATEIERTLGCLLKEAEDVRRVDDELLTAVERAAAAADDRLEQSNEGAER